MKKLSYVDYMNDEFDLVSQEDEKKCLECWNNGVELTVDDFGRVFNEAGVYIADIKEEK